MKLLERYTILLVFQFVQSSVSFAQIWIHSAEFEGTGRYYASGFAIGNKGYLGLGSDNNLIFKDDFWEYDPNSNLWTEKASIPCGPVEESVGFSIGNKGYMVCYNVPDNFWEYDPGNDIWLQKNNFPGAIVGAASFSIGKKGYVVTGSYSRALWEWDGDTGSSTYDTWTQKAPFPLPEGRHFATGFSIGTKGYLATGTNGQSFKQDLWEWDGDTHSSSYNTWSQKASLPGNARINAASFAHNTYGYVCFGLDFNADGNLKDCWKWNQSDNTWSLLPEFPGSGRQNAVAFSILNIGYIGTGFGNDSQSLKDFWAYCDTCYLGTEEHFSSAEFRIYPNPASESFILEILNDHNIYELMILNQMGIEILNSKIRGSKSVDITNVPAGLYFVIISDNEKFYSTKLIIERY